MSASSARPRGLLEKALASDSCHLPAVYLLAEIFDKNENKIDKAIDLLDR